MSVLKKYICIVLSFIFVFTSIPFISYATNISGNTGGGAGSGTAGGGGGIDKLLLSLFILFFILFLHNK